MEAMDALYRLYTQHVADLRQAGEYLNSLYPEPSRIPVRCMPRSEFEQYLTDGGESESKRFFLLRILKGNEELLSKLPESVRHLKDRRAA